MHYTDQKSLELAASYSLMPNMLKYCGENDFYGIFRRYLSNKSNPIAAAALSDSLKKFKGHYAYLKTIAQANRKRPFDKEVVNAFWIGNNLLHNVSKERIKQLILNDLCLAGMGKQRAANKARGLPNGIMLHHSFNSIYLNFVGNKVPRTVNNYDKCRIGWGKVIKVNADSVVLLYWPLALAKDKYIINKPVKRRFRIRVGDITLVKDLKEGDYASTHWGLVVQKLSKKELNQLKMHTISNLFAINIQHL